MGRLIKIKGIPSSDATVRLISSPPGVPDALVTTKEIFHCRQSAFSKSAEMGGRRQINLSGVKPDDVAAASAIAEGKILANKVDQSCQD